MAQVLEAILKFTGVTEKDYMASLEFHIDDPKKFEEVQAVQ